MAGILVAVFMGVFVTYYAMYSGGRFGILLALPSFLILIYLFAFSRNTLFYLVILFRSVMDPIFETAKFGAFGLGAAVNALVILIAILAVIEKPNPVRKVLSSTWLPFLLISLVTLVIAPDFTAAIKLYLTLFSYAAVFALAVVLIANEDDYGRWMRVVLLSSLIPVLYGFVDAATGGYVSADKEAFRINSTFYHPNIFAFYLVFMISLGFYFVKSKVSFIPEWVRKTLPIYILMMLALLLMTKTRSAWISCLAFFMIYAIIYERKYLVWIGLSLLASLMVPEIRDRILDLGQGNEVINYSKLNSFAWRKQIWHDGLNWMKPSHYFFGYGLGAFKYYTASFFTMWAGKNMDAHSVYVQLFFDVGAAGLAAYFWLNIKLAKLLLPFYKTNKLMIFSVLMFLLEYAMYSFSDNMLFYLSFDWYFWFVLGAVYAVNYSKKVNAEQTSNGTTPIKSSRHSA